MTVVMDASVGIALLRPEKASPLARAAIHRWLNERTEVIVPSLFWLEIVNGLTRGRRDTGATTIEALYELDRVGLTTVEIDRPALLIALDLIERWRLTAYDAIYLALAQSLGAELATFDRTLIAAGGSTILDLSAAGSQRTSESSAPYGTAPGREVTWPNWSGAGSYLATLRRRALAEAASPPRRR